jgi:micrococcal nuclease
MPRLKWWGRGMTGNAGKSFTGGFFGCLGVLGAIVVVLFALMVFGARSSGAEERAAGQPLTAAVTVVDGDTFDAGAERYRIEGLDAPELSHPACPLERERALTAKAALEALLASGPVHVEVTRRQPAKGYYRERAIARVTAGGRDVRQAMIDNGTALPWAGRNHNWCAATPVPSPG